jgi:RAB protein geranylgeranyltransferase component A
VSSKVYRQLDFLAVGSFWIYSAVSDDPTQPPGDSFRPAGRLLRVPNGREDVFQDQVLDFKAKRALMKFLRFIAEYEEQSDLWEQDRNKPFPDFLIKQFKLPSTLHAPLLALTLSPASSSQTTTEFALPRIARHLRSIGFFGAGFGFVIPKWGGISEITQVACRACAVGGGVYVLGKGLAAIANSEDSDGLESGTSRYKLRLKDGESVTAKQVVGESLDAPPQEPKYSRSIIIVSSSLDPLFPPIAEDAPSPACAVVIFPSGSLPRNEDMDGTEAPPVYISIHNSDAGECPAGQSE